MSTMSDNSRPLYDTVGEAGYNGMDITEGHGTLAELDELVEFMNSYDVTADPSNDQYLLQDDQHQYTVSILNVDPEDNMAVVKAEYSRFAKEGLEGVNVLYGEEDLETDPRDEAIFGEGSNSMKYSADRAPDRHHMSENEPSGGSEILEPDVETGWGWTNSKDQSGEL